MGATIGEMSVRIGADISSFTNGMNSVFRGAQEFSNQAAKMTRAASSIGEGINKAAGGVGSLAKSAVQGAKSVFDFTQKMGFAYYGLKGFGDAAIGVSNALTQPNAQLEQATIAFTQMLGSGQKAKAFLNQLQAFANKSPFEFNDLTDAAKHMMAFGFSAQDVLPMMTAVGDATSALGAGQDGINRVVVALGQMRAAGKLNAEDMNQLTDVGIPAWGILAQSMGLSVAQVQQLSQQGKIASDTVIPKLIAGMEKAYGGQMASQAKTFNGLASNLADIWSTVTRTLTKPIFEVAKQGLQTTLNLLSSPKFNDFVTMLGNKMAGAIKAFADFVNNNGKPAVLWLIGFFQQFNQQILKTGALSDLVGAFKDLADAVGGALSPVLQPIIDKFKDIAGKAQNNKDVISRLHDAIQSTTDVVHNLAGGIDGLSGFFQSDSLQAQILKDALAGLAIAITAVKIAKLASQLPDLITTFAIWSMVTWDQVVATWALAAPYLAIVVIIAAVVAIIILVIMNWGAIVGWLSGVWGAFSSWFMGLLGTIGAFFSSMWGGIVSWFIGLWTGVSSWFVGLWTSIMGFFGGLGEQIGAVWQGIVGVLASIWSTVVGVVSGVFMSIINAIVGFFVNVGLAIANNPVVNWFAQVFITINNIIFALLRIAFTFIVGIFISIGTAVWGAISGAFATISAFLGGALAWIIGLFTGAWKFLVAMVTFYWNWIVIIVQTVLAAVWGVISSVLSAIVNFMRDRWNTLVANVTAVWNWISGYFSSVWGFIWGIFGGALARIAGYLGAKWNEMKALVSSVWGGISSYFSGVWNNLVKIAVDKVTALKNGVFNVFRALRDGIGAVVKGFVNNIVSGLNNGIATAEGFVNSFGHALNWIADKLGTKGTIPDAHFPRIPQYASGTEGHPGGPALVGERGRELAMLNGRLAMLGIGGPQLVNLPKGASVLPNNQTERLVQSGMVPGYADGVGDFFSWLGGGAKSVLDNVLSMFGVSTSFKLPQVLTNVATGLFNKVKDVAISWVQNLLPHFDMGSATDVPGNVQQWIEQAILATHVPGNWLGPLAQMAMQESGGNPNAVNNWDSNAMAGDPSKGLFQTIGATFARYMLPGHGNIFNPVDNAIAAIRYIQARYGDVFNVPGIVAMSSGAGYVGYANGGIINETIAGFGLSSGKRYAFGENGAEAVVPLRGGNGSGNGPTTIIVQVGTKQIAKEILPDLVGEIRLATGR